MSRTSTRNPGNAPRAGLGSPVLIPGSRHAEVVQSSGGFVPADTFTGVDPEICRPELLQDIFEAQARAHPSRVAVVDGARELTYAEVDARSTRLAHYLRSQEIGRGDYIALLLPRSADVYIAILGILKAGAAYVPLDPDYPTARIVGMIEDAEVTALLTSTTALLAHDRVPARTILIDVEAPAIDACPATPLAPSDRDAGWRDPCYVIYTSGSTGRPKGVVIEHRSACNYVRSAALIYQTTAEDRVFQGFSISFDFAVEEIWMAFGVGAALVVGTMEVMRSGPALSAILTELRVTALSCVPTLLATMENDVPTLRLLNVGGEQCPQDLVTRWGKPGRRVLNTYGPTEVTVTATWSELRPGKPVTIGCAMPNYAASILDADMREVKPGEEGELYLSGPGVARGYLHRPDLTAERFVPSPFTDRGSAHTVLYKTGDLASYNAEGEILFHGRIDGQVKFRGFRIELSEIETVLMEQPGVAAAVVALRERSPGVQALAAYIVAKVGEDPDNETIKSRLRHRLPHYMMPNTLDRIDAVPVMTSGKVDRKSLPEPEAYAAVRGDETLSDTEAVLMDAFERTFKLSGIALDADFFLDLGGHSLLAALAVSDLRKLRGFTSGIAVADIYAAPTVRGLADLLAGRVARAPSADTAVRGATVARPVSAFGYGACGAAQALFIALIFGLMGVEWAIPLGHFRAAIAATGGRRLAEASVAIVAILLIPVANLLLGIAAKWLLIGRYKAGEYPLWGGYYLRWWMVRRLQALAPLRYLSGTPLIVWYLRALGARVGRDVSIGTAFFQSFDLTEIGDGASIGFDAHLNGHSVESDLLKIGPIQVGSRAGVGNNSVLLPYTVVGAAAELGDKSLLQAGGTVPAGEIWSGSPARKTGQAAPPLAVPSVSRSRALGVGAMLALLTLLLPVVPLAAVAPGVLLTTAVNARWGFGAAALATSPSALLFVVALCLLTIGIKKVFVGQARPGSLPIQSAAYVRRWLLDRLMMFSLDLTNSLYATIYLAPYLRLLGARIGRHSEISTASHITPDLLTFGEGTFIADGACLGASTVRNGMLHVAETRIGNRSFIGNSALVPAATRIPDGCLVGCLSTPPSEGEPFPAGTSWLGLPAMFLPRRQETQHFPEELTFRPTRALYAKRGFVEYFRVTGPATIAALAGLVFAHALGDGRVSFAALPSLVLAYVGAMLLVAGAVPLVKWALMARYQPGARPLWSGFCWRTELVTALFENAYVPYLLNHTLGTPFAAWGMRAMGARVGQRVYFDSTFLTEFDLVQIGDGAALNANCSVQTHLFEDRVMKMDRLKIGKGCSVGEMAIVLYSSEMGDESTLGALSLLMKGESLPPDTHWVGCPAQEAAEARAPIRV